MTTRLLALAMWRCWYVLLLGMSLTMVGVVQIHERPGVYWTQVDVGFLAPKTARYPNSIEQNSASVISVAGLVQTELNKGVRVPATTSAGTTLAGRGVRDGYQIRLPNSGGQWALNYDRPVLDVQVIGSDPARVRQRLIGLVARINQELVSLQQSMRVRHSDYITTQSAPTAAQIFQLKGNPLRAMAATLALGFAATALACVGMDQMLRRRRSRSRRTEQRGHELVQV